MKFVRTGLILFTENYDACVEFYAAVVGLPIISQLDDEHSKLTVLEYGPKTYLMIETEGKAVPQGKSTEQNPVKLRFNVSNVDDAAAELRARGAEVTVHHEVWGTIADFLDPDGNLCSLREEDPDDTQFS